jgi:hypothetical protein
VGGQILKIHEHISYAIGNRRIHNEVRAILEANPQLWRDNNSFFVWIASTYEDSVLMAVRRQGDMDERSIPLARLLTEVMAYPHILSRQRFVEQVISLNLGLSDDAMNRICDQLVAPGVHHINADVVRAELCDLRERTKGIKEYTNRRIAHFDAKGPKDSPTVRQVHDVLDQLDRLREKYLLLLRGKKYKEPELPGKDTWKEIFRQPWIR